MELLALAVPFFVLALLIELAWDRWRGSKYYRLNDTINSLSTGTLSTTFGYFTRLLPLWMWGSALQHLALFDISPAVFDLSLRGIGLWLLALLAFDFCYYWFHRCSHEVSILWASHAVHHQSEDYNLSTALRQTSTGFLFGWLFYLPLFVIGIPLEVVLTVNAIDLIYQFWVHTQHIGKLGWLDRVFITPSNHRVHHAQNEVYIDRNYGGILILWDRLFGSYQKELDSEPVIFGVRKPLASWNPFYANWQVYEYLWFDAARTKRWRDKLGVWFRRTGWRPEDVANSYPRQPNDIASFRKFDPPLSAGVRQYLVIQLSFSVIAVLLIGTAFAQFGASSVVVPCALLWLQLYGLGLMNEQRIHARRFELLRILLAVPVLLVCLHAVALLPVAAMDSLITYGIYTSVSLTSLAFAKSESMPRAIDAT
ncbi:MAG: sterol desaturase family protein [Woeseia sp.]